MKHNEKTVEGCRPCESKISNETDDTPTETPDSCLITPLDNCCLCGRKLDF